MSVKDLFRETNYKILPLNNADGLGGEIESAEYASAYIEDSERFIPAVDFQNLSNFVHFGSAVQYYQNSFNRISSDYPFDGSLKEKQLFYNSSSYFDKYVFEEVYPRTNGYITLSPEGWGVSSGLSGNGFGQPAVNDYIGITGSMNVDNIYDLGDNRAANLRINGNNGNTIEFWLKTEKVNVALTQKEVIFDLWNGKTPSALPASEYGRFLVYLDWTIASPNPVFKVTCVSGAVNACTDQAI